MRIYLIYLDSFDSEFKGKTYHIYQMIESKTLNVFTYSSETPLPYKIGDTLLCELGYRTRQGKSQIYVKSVIEKYEQ